MKNLAQSFYNWYKMSIRNSKYRWVIIAGTLVYLFSPLDISPDFIPVIGWIDDSVVVTLLVAEVSQLMSEFLAGRSRKTSDVAVNENPVIEVTVE
ncbi:MAG: DUF1232 domain-containing protein [Synechococcales cyanobacterium T60_A2020_003]|nr:DUF1232 domain-containing protein [Synechococcales cyanobacterium T60_A2020_003]